MDVLLWMRTHKIVFSTDIVKMFRQINVHQDDWNLQQILWMDKNDQFTAFHLTTVTYGLNCAPFLALRVIQQLLKDEGQRFPKAVNSMTKGRYVDDIFGGGDSITEVKDIIQDLTLLCMAGGFPLQKWSSNFQELSLELNSESAQAVKIEPTLQNLLGLAWKPSSDTFHFNVQPGHPEHLTKRKISSEIAKLYDPLGLISPVLIRAKISLQGLWLLKVDWDDILPLNVQSNWIKFRQELQEIDQLSIPRWLGTVRNDAPIELHGFSDASQSAMAAVVYIRTMNPDGSPVVRLVCSKTRVAPLKNQTIPRLELTAALLLARLMKRVINALDLPNLKITCWTDSSVTLTWINTNPSHWKDFVRNRVTLIHETLPQSIWHFVSGKDNPADCATRGISLRQLKQYNQWWLGPQWLTEDPSSWTHLKDKINPSVDWERRPVKSLPVIVRPPSYWETLDRYSSLTKLLRVTATCSRFLSCLRRLPKSSPEHYPLTPKEIKDCRTYWIRVVQRSWFANEIKIISRGEQLPRSNPLGRITPYIDKDGLLRVGGRLQNTTFDFEEKHPYVLPRNSPLTILIIKDAHQRMLHGGTQVILCAIRKTFWIMGGRAPVRSHILKCICCARYRARRAQQLMGQLPGPRITPTRPFLHTGVDYARPITLKNWKNRGARTYKGYLAIFVCLATSAVHLEVVTSYNTEDFVAAYKRFTGRRGICATLYSDCGTNLIGANYTLRNLHDASVKELGDLAALLTKDGTEWKFIPPASPHFGGKWEAAVKSTKFHMKRILGETVLTYEEMTTVLIQIEAVLNSRPLCPLSENATDYSALTPGHFLIGEAPTVLPEPDLSAEPISRLKRWQLLQQMVQHYWNRWSRECLQRYQDISKWHHPSNEVKLGSLVLLTDERYPPGKWPLARVTELHPGQDGLTRVVTVKTATTSYKRPITKLCVLPVDSDTVNSTKTLSKAGGNVRISMDNCNRSASSSD